MRGVAPARLPPVSTSESGIEFPPGVRRPLRKVALALVVLLPFAAVAGGFQAHYIGLLSPTPMKFNEMAVIIIMVISGGFRTFSGPVLGAVFIEFLSEELRAWGEIRMVLFAILVIVVVRAYPAGLRGLCIAAAKKLTLLAPGLTPLLTPRRPED